MANTAAGDAARWRVEPGAPLDLATIDTSSTDGAPGRKQETVTLLDDLRTQLGRFQERLWAEHRQSLLVVLQSIDAGGKDGTVRHVFRGIDPQGVKVTSFKAPSEVELDHDFLWRCHSATPAKGEIAVWNRSHYEDVLIVRVKQLVPEEIWRPRFEHIRAFEDNLAGAGTRIVKFFLHISPEEQAVRLRSRLHEPEKRWKFRIEDLDERACWDDYQTAFTEAITKTTTEASPWYVIPADRKWYRNWAVSRVLLETLDDMDPQFPEPEAHLDEVVIV